MIKPILSLRFLVLPVLAISLTVLGLWYANLPAPSVMPSIEDVQREAERGGYRLITTDALWQRYQAEGDKILLVDTRQDWEYRAGHIEGAENFPMAPTWLGRWRQRAALEKCLGTDKQRPVVFY